MYEESKIKFDWKGFLLKFAIIILVVILVIKLVPFQKKEKSESFTSNQTKLKDVSISYFQNKNLPENDGDEKKLTLNDLIVSGKISKLQDAKGNDCDEDASYIKATKKDTEYEVDVYLKCGSEEEHLYVYKTKCEETKCEQTTTTTTKKATTTTKKASNNTNNSNSNTSNSNTTTTKKQEYITKVVTKERKYYVVFDTDKASSIPTQVLKLGEKATIPSTPVKTGYTFIGWYYNDKEYDFNTPVTSNIIITAKWKKN